jgi:hypothetical protein
MKKILFSLLCVVFFGFISLDCQAQQTWEWEAYKVRIDLPEDFKVIQNTNNEFEAEGYGMGIYMYVFEENISLEEMKDATILAASEMELEEWDVVLNVKTQGFEGKYIAGYLNGYAILLCGLINPDNITNFFVVISFNDDDTTAEEAAFVILDSIRRSN